MNDVTTLSIQEEFVFNVEKQVVIDGIEMGVLNTGEPYLTGDGLAKMCGISPSTLSELANNWKGEQSKPRGRAILQILNRSGLGSKFQEGLFTKAKLNGIIVNAYTEPVCLTILEYYAFEASETKDRARQTFRILATKKFREFIYDAVGYKPYNELGQWQQFHDRVSLNYDSVPIGYFSIFKEISDLIVNLGQNGLYIDEHFVPDISIGKIWGAYWSSEGFDNKYGERKRYLHNYPVYFSQAKSNPQESWCYPEDALGEFRKWFREQYIGEGKFKKYLTNKVNSQELPHEFAQKAIEAYKK